MTPAGQTTAIQPSDRALAGQAFRRDVQLRTPDVALRRH